MIRVEQCQLVQCEAAQSVQSHTRNHGYRHKVIAL